MVNRDTKDERKRLRQRPLTRERALATAMKLADEKGIAALTMRKLAQRLGVEAMSLYHHVRNKDDILAGMVDMVFAEIDLPNGEDDWKTAMDRRARLLQAALLRHPWAIALMDAQTEPGPATLRHHDAVIGSCLAAGFSIEMAGHAFSLIDSYVYGFVMQVINLPFDDASEMEGLVEMILAKMQPEQHPHLTALTRDLVLQPGYSYGNEFDFGLELILSGLEGMARG